MNGMGAAGEIVVTGLHVYPIKSCGGTSLARAEIGRGFEPISAQERQRILAKSAPHAAGGPYEPFKTSHDYEGNEARREHGLPVRAAD